MIFSPFCADILTVNFSLFLSEQNDEKVAGHFDLCLSEHAHCLCLFITILSSILCEVYAFYVNTPVVFFYQEF